MVASRTRLQRAPSCCAGCFCRGVLVGQAVILAASPLGDSAVIVQMAFCPNHFFEALFYATLFAAAARWRIVGEILHFQGACAWRFAFLFIALNVVECQLATSTEA